MLHLCMDFCLDPRCAGYLFQKVGKIAATAVGGGFLLLQVGRMSHTSAATHLMIEAL